MLRIKNYLSLVKFAHTIFAMPFALIGFFYGLHIINYEIYRPWWVLLFLVILCMVFARSAAMAFNRWLDAEHDAKNPRTAIREIPAELFRKKMPCFLSFLIVLPLSSPLILSMRYV